MSNTDGRRAAMTLKNRRIRLCICPYCLCVTPASRATRGHRLTTCSVCYAPFDAHCVESWLEETEAT